MPNRIHSATTTVFTIAAIAFLWASSIPLGVPGEWTWQRHEGFGDVLGFLDRILPAAIGAGGLFAVAVFGADRVSKASWSTTVCLYCGLLAASVFWLSQVQSTPPQLHRNLKPDWVLYDKSSSGYFHEAVFKIESVGDFLATYEERMQEGEVLHVGTHPPGLFLLSRTCIDLCETLPSLSHFLQSTRSSDRQEAFRSVERGSRLWRPLQDHEFSGLRLLSLLTQLSVSLTIIPLAILTTHLANRETAWRVCCLWSTLPCLAVFLPKSDLLFPLTTTTIVAFSVLAMNQRHRLVLSVLAGITLWLGLMLSLAHLPAIVALVVFVAARFFLTTRTPEQSEQQLRLKQLLSDLRVLCIIAGIVVLLSVLFSVATHCNLFNVWRWNLKNHEGFYGEYVRTWWKWFLTNPIELCFAVGPFVFLSAIAGIRAACVRQQTKDDVIPPDAQSTTMSAMILAMVATFALLWLSGKNQGEAARLWCFLTPWLLVCAAAVWRQKLPTASWKYAVGLQLAYCIATVSRVNGFSF